MIFQDINFWCYRIIFFIFSGNCSARRCKCVNNTTVNKKFPCTGFCSCGPTCENTDSDPILENSNSPDNDDEKVFFSFYFIFFYIYNLHFFKQKTYSHQVLIYLNVPGIPVRKPLQNRQIVKEQLDVWV